MLSRGVLFHQGSAPPHTSLVAMATIRNCGFEIVTYPPDLPVLAPFDFHLSHEMKNILAGQHFAKDNDVIKAVEKFLRTLSEEFFSKGIKALQHC